MPLNKETKPNLFANKLHANALEEIINPSLLSPMTDNNMATSLEGTLWI